MDEKPPQAAGECPEVPPRKREALALFAGLPWQDAGIEQVHARPMSLGGGVVMWGVWR
jgi:hypothetical protein